MSGDAIVKKIIMVVFIVALSMLVSISGFSKAKIRNRTELQIVPSSQALIAINPESFDITIHKQGTENNFVTPSDAIAVVKITNHSTNDLTIKNIKCITVGFETLTVDFESTLLADRTKPATITVDSSRLTGVESLKFIFEAEWDGGKTEIRFTVPVVKHEVIEQLDEGEGQTDENGVESANLSEPGSDQ